MTKKEQKLFLDALYTYRLEKDANITRAISKALKRVGGALKKSKKKVLGIAGGAYLVTAGAAKVAVPKHKTFYRGDKLLLSQYR